MAIVPVLAGILAVVVVILVVVVAVVVVVVVVINFVSEVAFDVEMAPIVSASSAEFMRMLASGTSGGGGGGVRGRPSCSQIDCNLAVHGLSNQPYFKYGNMYKVRFGIRRAKEIPL